MTNVFQMGWFNHQLVKITVDVFVIFYPEDDSSSPKIIHGGMSWIKPRANAEDAESLFWPEKEQAADFHVGSSKLAG